MLWQLLVVPLLIALNAFFVSAEYAIVGSRAMHVDELRKRGRRRAADAVVALKANPAATIGAVQVCITMTNLLLGWLGEPAMGELLERLLGPMVRLYPRVFHFVSLAVSFLVVTLLTVVFSELLPKALTLRYVVTAAAITTVPVLAIRSAVSPLVAVMNGLANLITRPLGLGRVQDFEDARITPDEIRSLATQAAEDGTVTPQERAMILNALSIGHLPLCDGGLDHVVGVIETKEFLSAYNASGDVSVLSLIAQPPVFVPETVGVDRLLTMFRESGSPLLFAVDEYGGVEGIVTLRDVLEELV
jgi:CBS domain containing-hemolysin-like protein